MRAIAIDDEPMALEIVKSHALKVPFLDLAAQFTDAFKALEYLQKEKIDLIFLDIKMPDISGLDFFNSLSKKPLVIFTTAYTEHAVTSFELDAVDYLLKPFSLARFVKSCNKAYELFNYRNSTEPEDYLFVKDGYDQLKIRFDEILFLEAAGNYVTFTLQDKKVLTRSTFAEAINLLPSEKFVRIHRSYIVAVSKIEKVERHQVTIKGIKVPVSGAYRDDLQKALG
ncbi:LytTR family DNA-binding domain-containing protein [Antarcticibacterium sp. 1MA-6-2]|uniref:LytR/AlgR family response regulator transcription factor n=1 Tax=Antarcticibacterium sp. 1MA-6-2 TaxID=2908210 RepID=UPI001F2626BC|nr:LytTR family DNA-binding domain-containing protein [Antarcticibacterium sp. 1MA-6-2]UJH92356.1 LytTR family DNA-binding domain-containing protein [Antarcticibacterium sp. 1MA-6-2]